MKHRKPLLLLFALFTACLLSACGEDASLPDGGYDYRLYENILLGYPIPRKGENGYMLSAGESFAAFAVEKDGGMRFVPCETGFLTLAGGSISVPYAEYGGKTVYFSFGEDCFFTAEGEVDGCAVVLSENELRLVCGERDELICDFCTAVCDVKDDAVLYLASAGRLFLYRGGESVSVTPMNRVYPVLDAWFLPKTSGASVLFITENRALFSYSEEGGIKPCVIEIPEENLYRNTAVLRGTALALCGEDASLYPYDLLTGEKLPVDLGGLFRFRGSFGVTNIPCSPDGMFLYFYDYDDIYRVSSVDGSLSFTPNDALVFDGRCVISSMTAVTDEWVLLSQAENEATEYVPVVTPAVFSEDVPAEKEDDFRP